MRSSFPLTLTESDKEVLFQINEFSESTICRCVPIADKECFFALWVKEGKGKFVIDGAEYAFESNSLISFVPSRDFVIYPSEEISGISICFHSDFYNMEHHAQEIGCDLVVFKSIYSFSILSLSDEQVKDFSYLESKMVEEVINPINMAKRDALVSYLKIFLINVSRIRLAQLKDEGVDIQIPLTLVQLQKEIERNFRRAHSPSHYAELLCMEPKSLNKLVKKYYNKTLTQVIQERIITEAKKELYQSDKPIKNIAFDLGFTDAFYFSRLFKKKLSVSPENYRIEKV